MSQLPPHAVRAILWSVASLLLLVAAMLTWKIYVDATAPPPRFELIEGRLGTFKLDTSGKSSTTVLFSIDGRPGRYWTQAMSHSEVANSWQTRPRHLKFYIQSNGHWRPKHGDAVKTFGLWVDGQQVQSLEQRLGEDRVLGGIIQVLCVVVYALAFGCFVWAYRSRQQAASH